MLKMYDRFMDSPTSIVFDRAAEFYDRTRALSETAQRQIVERLTPELAGADTVLEVGIGTGRIALPLVDAGVRVVGVDLSAPMLNKLFSNAAGRPVTAVLGNATDLPFGDETVDAAFGCHILHLIKGWRGVCEEMVRVLKPDGRILIDAGGVDWNPDELEKVFAAGSGLEYRHIGLESIEELDEQMLALGGEVRVLEPVIETNMTSTARRLEAWEQNLWSFTWRLEEDARLEGVRQARLWAEANIDDINAKAPHHRTITWRAYDF